MPLVSIVMGSDSDLPVMNKAADILDKLGISYEMNIISAHREPDEFFEYARSCEDSGIKVIIGNNLINFAKRIDYGTSNKHRRLAE